MTGKLARCAILIVLLLVLGGCGVTSDRSDKASPDWSRGLKVGMAHVNQPVALQVDGRGHAHLVWYARINEVDKLHYVQLDEQAKVLVDKDLDLPPSQFYPRRPQLLLDGQGNLHLAWIASAEDTSSLFHILLGEDGETLSEATRLSPPGQEVSSFQMCLNGVGQIEVVWAGEGKEEGGGIYYLHLKEGEASSPILLVSQGTNPTIQIDNANTVHLAWLQEPSPEIKDLYYAAFPVSEVTPQEGLKLAQFPLGIGLVLHGPVLGLDTTNVYIFWAVERRGGGLEDAGAVSRYVSFPLGQPQASKLATIGLPPISKPRYLNIYSRHWGPLKGVPFDYTMLAPFYGGEEYTTDYLDMPAVVRGQRTELPVVFSLKVQSKRGAEVQPAMAVFSKGELKGYQLVAKTDSVSLQPNVTAFGPNLHLAWIDTAGFWRYDVYYASTSPKVKAWLDRTSPQDLLMKAMALTWGVLSGLALIPLTFAWIFPPLIGVILFEVFGGDDDLGRWPARVVLGVAVTLYLASKFMLSSAFLLFAPLSDEVPAMIVVVPVVILALALGAMYGYMRRTERRSLLMAFAVFVLTDALLSLAIYSPGFFGGG